MNLSMIGSYLRSKWSKGLSENRADVTTKDIRLLSCFGNSDDITVCPGLRPSEKSMGKFICGECGCGDKPDTILNTTEDEYGKLDHPYVTCPRFMPGFSNYKSDRNDKRKVLIEVSIGKDVMKNKELVNPTPPPTDNESNSPGCPKCEAARKAREAAGEKTEGGGCTKCEARRKQLEAERNLNSDKSPVQNQREVVKPQDSAKMVERARRIIAERRKNES